MDLPAIPLLSMLKERMSWLNQRQNVLSQNVANIDTPGYTARDLKPVDFEKALKAAGKKSALLLVATGTGDVRFVALSLE